MSVTLIEVEFVYGTLHILSALRAIAWCVSRRNYSYKCTWLVSRVKGSGLCTWEFRSIDRSLLCMKIIKVSDKRDLMRRRPWEFRKKPVSLLTPSPSSHSHLSRSIQASVRQIRILEVLDDEAVYPNRPRPLFCIFFCFKTYHHSTPNSAVNAVSLNNVQINKRTFIIIIVIFIIRPCRSSGG
jgi:hypothetical protein